MQSPKQTPPPKRPDHPIADKVVAFGAKQRRRMFGLLGWTPAREHLNSALPYEQAVVDIRAILFFLDSTAKDDAWGRVEEAIRHMEQDGQRYYPGTTPPNLQGIPPHIHITKPATGVLHTPVMHTPPEWRGAPYPYDEVDYAAFEAHAAMHTHYGQGRPISKKGKAGLSDKIKESLGNKKKDKVGLLDWKAGVGGCYAAESKVLPCRWELICHTWGCNTEYTLGLACLEVCEMNGIDVPKDWPNAIEAMAWATNIERDLREKTKPSEYDEALLRWFECGHLPKHLQAVSTIFAEAAQRMCKECPAGHMRTTALLSLLTAKDAAVRAKIEETDERKANNNA